MTTSLRRGACLRRLHVMWPPRSLVDRSHSSFLLPRCSAHVLSHSKLLHGAARPTVQAMLPAAHCTQRRCHLTEPSAMSTSHGAMLCLAILMNLAAVSPKNALLAPVALSGTLAVWGLKARGCSQLQAWACNWIVLRQTVQLWGLQRCQALARPVTRQEVASHVRSCTRRVARTAWLVTSVIFVDLMSESAAGRRNTQLGEQSSCVGPEPKS
mmetsp:Transcript_14176/g.29728  ORF Transcript_14176/g.29728 Transcript_14176/m.29728 type:complete len:212 (+) Transcript_14176:387-1022(+)